MSLQSAPLVYLFLETSTLAAQRHLYEEMLDLPLIEIEPHLPHHRHGVVKYDAGGVVLSLNLTGSSRFRRTSSDAITTVFAATPGSASVVERLRDAPQLGTVRSEDGATLFTDRNGHHYRFLDAPSDVVGRLAPAVVRFQLSVVDLPSSVEFYALRLGLTLLDADDRRAAFATGSVELELEQRPDAVDGREPRTATSLIVFHTHDLEATTESLTTRGVEFRSQHAGYSEIGGTIRFDDPSGHRLCLYQPSDESLTWGSGPKVSEIAAGRALAK